MVYIYIYTTYRNGDLGYGLLLFYPHDICCLIHFDPYVAFRFKKPAVSFPHITFEERCNQSPVAGVYICFELLLYVCHVALSFFKRRHVDLQSRIAKDCTRFFVSRTTPKTDVEACSSHSLVTTHWKAFPTAGYFSTVWSAHGFYMFLWFLWFLEIGPGQKRAANLLPSVDIAWFCYSCPLTGPVTGRFIRFQFDDGKASWGFVL